MERSWWIRALGNHQPYRPYQGQTRIWHLRPDLSARPLPAHHSPPRLHLRSPRQGQPWAGQAAARRQRQREGEGGHPRRELPASKLQPRPEPPWQLRPGRGGGCPHPKRQTPRLAPPHWPRRGAPPPCREALCRTSASALGCRRHSTSQEQDRPGSPVTPEQPGRHGHQPRTADHSLQTQAHGRRSPEEGSGTTEEHPGSLLVFRAPTTAPPGGQRPRGGSSSASLLRDSRVLEPSPPREGSPCPVPGAGCLDPKGRAHHGDTCLRAAAGTAQGSPAACPGEGGLRSPPRATVTGLGQHQHHCSKIPPSPSALSNCSLGNCWGQVLGEKRGGQRKTGTPFLLDHLRALHRSLSPR